MKPIAIRRCHQILLLAVVSVSCATWISTAWAQRRVGESVPLQWQNEAELTDVHFVNATQGWAVGEHGTILHTNDGGANWSIQPTQISFSNDETQITGNLKKVLGKVRQATGAQNMADRTVIKQSLDVRLESIAFLNERQGLAVGGYHEPYANISRATIFQTSDGGATWGQVSKPQLPRLNHLGQGAGGLFAVGGFSHFHSSGIFEAFGSPDEWLSVSQPDVQSWQSAIQLGMRWLLLDERGHIQLFENGKLFPAVVVASRQGAIHDLEVDETGTGWAVGENGLVLRTDDAGETWYEPQFVKQHSQLHYFDFQTVERHRDSIWFCGAPGSFVFQLDETNAIHAHTTGQVCQLNDMQFVDDTNGFAVGTLGVILKTVDGGKSWQRQRGEFHRVGLMAVGLDSDNMAFEALCRSSVAEDVLTAAVRINLDGKTTSPQILQQAAARLGVVDVRQIHASDAKAEPANDRRAQAVDHLVRLIREWQPNVIVVDAQATRLDDGQYLDAFLLVDEAIKKAADSSHAGDQLTANALSVWQVDRLVVPTAQANSDWRLDEAAFLPELGTFIADETAMSRALVGQPLAMPHTIACQVKSYGNSQPFAGNRLFQGLDIHGKPVPRRESIAGHRGNLQDVTEAWQKQNMLTRLSQLPLRSAADQVRWSEAVNSWLQFADHETAGIWLAQLAESYCNRGDLESAFLTLDFLTANYFDHPLTPTALAIMAHYVSSRELQILKMQKENSSTSKPKTDMVAGADRKWQSLAAKTNDESTIGLDEPAAPIAKDVFQDNNVRQTSAEVVDDSLATEGPEANKRQFWQRSLEQLMRLRQRDPELAATPEIRILEANAFRHSDSWKSAQNVFKNMASPRNPEPLSRKWALSILGIENGMSENDETRSWRARQTNTKPMLDGALDDDVWQSALANGAFHSESMTPPFGDRSPRTDYVIVSFDESYLYIALRCTRLPGVRYPAPARERERNPEMKDSDRVLISLDLDGDAGWAFQLAVDSQGNAGDGCGGSLDWDPDWFVATAMTPTHWTAEMAIPWEQLGGMPEKMPVWNIGLARVFGKRSDQLWGSSSPAVQYSLPNSFFRFPIVADDGFRQLQFERVTIGADSVEPKSAVAPGTALMPVPIDE
ncbi:MAG: YCF48-related protein [Pirellulaceae bacterium]